MNHRERFEIRADCLGYWTDRYEEDMDSSRYKDSNTDNAWGWFCEGLSSAAFGDWLPIEKWDEGWGAVLWTRVPVEEPYYFGTPLDETWVKDYYTYFLPFSCIPSPPIEAMSGEQK